MANNHKTYLIGVDVGTGSVRAALVNDDGKIIKTSTCPIETWNPNPDFYEQSSNDIWSSCCKVIKDLIIIGVKPEHVKGIGFDATCSLVAVDKDGRPVSISPTGNNEQNIILWMDHRAEYEAKQINETRSSVLQYVGGKISLEMEIPKLVWLKKHLKHQCWDKTDLFFDLPDYLTWRATGSETRSLCSLVCKWTYEVQSNKTAKWNEDFFNQIGLDDLKENHFRKIGNTVLSPGTPCGSGLKPDVAKELGLLPGTPVGTSIIDAHAGGLGMIACTAENIPVDFDSRIGLICGTSTCHMAVSKDPIFVPGVWGPYFSAMVPNMWLNEGGQSATGKLIDHIIETHPAYHHIKTDLNQMHIQEYLSKLLLAMEKEEKIHFVDLLTKDFHVWPDFHGNRSPLADPNLKGMISGLTLGTDPKNLALLYLATIQALAYGTRHIIETLKDSGYKNISQILICGGLSKNPLFVQTQADVMNIPVLCPEESESVLLGSAILGACAAKVFENVESACKNMAGKAKVVFPNAETHLYHNKKYKVFLKMIQDQKEFDNIMNM